MLCSSLDTNKRAISGKIATMVPQQEVDMKAVVDVETW